MSNLRSLFPQTIYPFSDKLFEFIDHNKNFRKSLRLVNRKRFFCFPQIFCTDSPINSDEVIGLWYLDMDNLKTGKTPLFRQDFIVNELKQGNKWSSYISSQFPDLIDNKVVFSIKVFFDLYGKDGEFFHNGKKWQHRYNTINDLPDEPDLRKWANETINYLNNRTTSV